LDLTPKEMEELRLGAITAIDGLWFLAAERKLGFERAFELDLDVWREYGLVMLKRLSRIWDLDLAAHTPLELETANLLMETICHIDGTKAFGKVRDGEIIFRVETCSWWENLLHAGREKTVPCEDVDNDIFAHWLKAMDADFVFEITHSRPRGNDYCEWRIRRPA
jgi:Family of unknown function (DUF6125)